MGFSGLMGFASGAARAAEQVADNNLARMDAQGLAQAKAQADMALQERINQYSIQKENRGYKREDFTHNRGLMDDKAKTADALAASQLEEKRKLSPEYLKANIDANNTIYTGTKKDQDKLAIDKQQAGSPVEVANIKEAGDDRRKKWDIEASKGKDGKALSESDKAGRYKEGKKVLDVAFNVSYNAFGMADPSTIKDKPGYYAALARLEKETYGEEGLPAAIANNITKGAITEQINKKAITDAYVKEKNSELGFWDSKGSNVQLDEKGDVIVPDGWQPSQAGQGKAPKTPKQESAKTPAAIPDKTSLKGGEEANGYVWNAKLGRAVPVKPMSSAPAAPVAPAKARGLMSEAGAATMPKSTGASINGITNQNEFDALPLPKNLKDANSEEIYFEKDSNGKNVYYTVRGDKKIKLDIKDTI